MFKYLQSSKLSFFVEGSQIVNTVYKNNFIAQKYAGNYFYIYIKLIFKRFDNGTFKCRKYFFNFDFIQCVVPKGLSRNTLQFFL